MKETINEMKMQPIEWEKIFENYISDKGLIYKVQKNSNELNNNKKITVQLKNGERTWVDIFLRKIYKWPTDTWKDTQPH